MPHKRKDLKIEGVDLWYFVGLITGDGCLSPDGRHIDITSKDHHFLRRLTKRLKITNKVGVKDKGTNRQTYHIQIANRNFYDFLLSIGLMPNKSLVINDVNVPRVYFVDFLRGLIDGDGCIRKWIHPSNRKEQWNLRIYSGSSSFIAWLNNMVESLLKVKGKIYRETDTKWILKYGKMAAREIVKKCYYEDCFGLQRKVGLARDCMGSYRGWSKSRTVNFN